MQITNRDLALVASAAFIMTACAVLMTVHTLPGARRLPPAPSQGTPIRPQVTRTGGSPIDPQGPLQVRLATGTATSALLTCDQFKAERPFERREAWFPSLPVGDCAVALNGARPYGPVYPGDVLRCAVEDGYTTCTGGLATSRAANVTVTSAAPAVLFIDGEEIGETPASDLSLRVGRRDLRLEFADGREARYGLVLEPDQEVTVAFPQASP